MRLVQVNPAFDPRLDTPERLLDAYHTLTGWSEALNGAGVSVVVVQSYSSEGGLHRRGVDYLFRHADGRATQGFIAAVRSFEPDIVHVNGFDAARIVSGLRRALPGPVPIVLQHHGGLPPRRFSAAGRALRQAMTAADGFLFTSRIQSEPWVTRGFVRRRGLVHDVLEASTTLSPSDSGVARERTGIGGSPALLWVGRLDANKDPLAALRGFELAVDALPGATLTMLFGADTLLGDVRRRVVQSDRLRARVRLVGRVPHGEMSDWYSAADLFLLGSHHESAGYALIEACACGVTPVVTDIAPFRAISGNGSIGRHWPVGDSAACASAIVSAARELGEHSRPAVLDRFRSALSWESVGARARGAYEAVIAQRREAGPGTDRMLN